jgi:quinol monooxygenase YgiN
MIVASVRVVAPPGGHPELLRLLNALLAPMRVQPGCMEARLYLDVDDPDALTMIHEWRSQADLDRFLASDAGKVIVAVLERSRLPPELHFDTVATRGGLEVIALARSDLSRLRHPRKPT